MKKTSKKKIRVSSENIRNQRKVQSFSVVKPISRIITKKGTVIDVDNDSFNGGIVIDLVY